MRCGDRQIKNLSRGSRCYFPVFVPGANLSVGDLHFSQGDVRAFSLFVSPLVSPFPSTSLSFASFSCFSASFLRALVCLGAMSAALTLDSDSGSDRRARR